MATNPPADLFAYAGLDLPSSTPAPTKRSYCPAQFTATARAATGLLRGARRFRPVLRDRVGPPRRLAPAAVLAFPLCRNNGVVLAMNERMPGRHSKDLASICDREARKLEKRLIYKGIGKQSARRCAIDLLHEVYMKRVDEVEKGT